MDNYYNKPYGVQAESQNKAQKYFTKAKIMWRNLWQKSDKQYNNEQYQNPQVPQQYLDQMQNTYASNQQAQNNGEQQDFAEQDYGSLKGGYKTRRSQQQTVPNYQNQQSFDNYDPQYDYNPQYDTNAPQMDVQHLNQQQQTQFTPNNPAQLPRNNVVVFNTGESMIDNNSIKIGVFAIFELQNCIDLISQMQGVSMFFVNMENFADVDKIRSCKDIILGACYALNYSMMCIGSNNMYLICPKTVAVNMNNATKNFLESIVGRKKTKPKYSINMDDAFDDNGLDYYEEESAPVSATSYGRRANFR